MVLATYPDAAHGRVDSLRHRASLFGLAPGGACHARFLTVAAVGSYSTVSPSPASIASRPRRFRQTILCGAIPKITLGGCYPPPYPRGARTFLERAVSSIAPAAV